MLEFRITNGQRLSRIDGSTVSAGTTDLYARFSCGENYSGVVTSYWRVKGEQQPYKVPLDAEGICLVPWEVLASKNDNELIYQETDHYVSVSIADADITTSSECEFAVKRTAYSQESFDPENPPTDTYQKLIDMINAGQLRGESAYEAAVEMGFEGTKEEWIESLEGEKGEPFTVEDFEQTEAYQAILDQEDKRKKDTEEAIRNTEQAEEAAGNAAINANQKAELAESAATSANNAAENANFAAINDAEMANLADTAAANANKKASLADVAAANATEKANLADLAAQAAGGAIERMDKSIDEIKGELSDLAPAGAAVGQLFRVAEISEDGKYIMEPVDMPSGGVTDVIAGNTSIVDGGVAKIPIAKNDGIGLLILNKPNVSGIWVPMGCTVDDNGFVKWAAQEVAE